MNRIVIDLASRKLFFYNGYNLLNTYPVAIGKPSTPTPIGSFKIINKLVHPGGGLGTRWMELNIPTDGGPYGIHGTNNPSSIGQAVSNGCIRMYNHDIEAIFPQVEIGTPVEIVAYGYSTQTDFKRPQKVYIVQPQDNFLLIAQNHGVSPDALLIANPTVNPNLIYPGLVLIIP